MAPGGRSTGCRTCRKRHLKCDEARPTCRRCQKAGVECRGYDVIEVFVDERSKILQRGSKSRPDKRKRAGSQTNGQTNGVWSVRGAGTHSPGSTSEDTDSFPGSPSSGGSSPRSMVPLPSASAMAITRLVAGTTISPLATTLPLMKEDIYMTFMMRTMFSRMQTPMDNSVIGIRDASTMGNQRRSWLLPVLRQGRDAAPLASALAALARAWFAKAEGQPSVATQGMGYYSKALVELKGAISTDKWRQRHVLLAAMLLALYETVMMEDDNAWVNHTKGLAHLFEAQGAENFQDQVGIGILRANRYGMIMSSIINGQKSFLAHPSWRTVPWQRLPHLKQDNDYLFDTLAMVPGLLRDVTEWEKRHSAFPQKAMDGILTSLRELCEWRWSWETANPKSVQVDSSVTNLPPSLFSPAVRFDSMISAHVISVYGSTMILLLLLAQRLRGPDVDLDLLVGPTPPDAAKTNPLILPGFDRLDVVEIAREICRTIKFRMHRIKGSAIAFSLLLPMRVTWQILKDFPPEAQWLQSVAVFLQQNSALQFPRLMFDGDSSYLFRHGSRVDEITELGMDPYP